MGFQNDMKTQHTLMTKPSLQTAMEREIYMQTIKFLLISNYPVAIL